MNRSAVACWFGAGLLLAMMLPSALSGAIDPRELHGVSVWSKPLKFQLAFTVHLLTLIVALRLLAAPAPGQVRPPRHAALYPAVVIVVLCVLLEALYIQLQAARGRDSHFNRETPLEAALYFGGMGTGALLILAGTAVVGWAVWRSLRTHGDSGLRRGMALGLLVGSAATLVSVVPLSSGMVDGLGHWVGGTRSDAQGLPLAGWSTDGGDLRVPHFFATHLMQALPLAGWLADQVRPTGARGVVLTTLALGLALVAGTLMQAVAGRPLITP